MERWQNTVRLIMGLHPQHLSLYALTLEHGTPFGRWANRGLIPFPDPDSAAEMYEWADDQLSSAGYENYEISNWSLPGYQCKHNLQYWRNQPYLGFGAGAHGYAGGYRYSNVLRIKTFNNRLEEIPANDLPFPLSSATVNHHRNTPRDDMQETMMTTLRLTREGISTRVFRERFGLDLMEVFGNEIEDLTRLGLLEWADDPLAQLVQAGRSIRLSKRGRLLGNQVFMRFVGE
jgi:oxygen-independent coproporphyrinogen-3 oxidase